MDAQPTIRASVRVRFTEGDEGWISLDAFWIYYPSHKISRVLALMLHCEVR